MQLAGINRIQPPDQQRAKPVIKLIQQRRVAQGRDPSEPSPLDQRQSRLAKRHEIEPVSANPLNQERSNGGGVWRWIRTTGQRDCAHPRFDQGFDPALVPDPAQYAAPLNPGGKPSLYLCFRQRNRTGNPPALGSALRIAHSQPFSPCQRRHRIKSLREGFCQRTRQWRRILLLGRYQFFGPLRPAPGQLA